jgi:hypothetical protein
MGWSAGIDHNSYTYMQYTLHTLTLSVVAVTDPLVEDKLGKHSEKPYINHTYMIQNKAYP